MRLHQGDPVLSRLIRIDGRGNVELLALRSLPPELRRKLQFEWNEFLLSPQGGTMKGFLFGEVGNKKPDVVEVMLSSGALPVIDATFRSNHPIHAFKTAFYRAVLEQVTGVGTVTAGDYRSGRRQTPVGP